MYPDGLMETKVYKPGELAALKGSQDLYAVVGFPVAHSLSPVFQEAGFRELGIEARYVRVEVEPDGLPSAVEALRGVGFRGWNCTLPHKHTMLELCDELDDSARQLEAVNTVLHEDGRLTGFNTDGQGWVRGVRQDFCVDVRDMRVMLLGAGGAGRALAIQSALEKCERLVLVNRTYEKVEGLARELAPLLDSEKLMGAHERVKAIRWEEDLIAEEIGSMDLVVNATSVGLRAHDPAVLPSRILQPHLLVYDTIYRRTRLLMAAQEAGARGASGASMLLHQGALAFEIWTGRTAPLAAMRKALVEAAG